MKETIRCCMSCIFPCGPFDVIHIFHASGHVEELLGPATAGDIIKVHPNHVLKKQPSSQSNGRALVLPPDAALQRGKIYFLVPVRISPSSCGKDKQKKRNGRRVKELENGKRNSRHGAEISTGEQERGVAESYGRSRVRYWKPKLDRIEEVYD